MELLPSNECRKGFFYYQRPLLHHNSHTYFPEKCIDLAATRFQKCRNINANLTFAVSGQVESEVVLALLSVDQLT